MEATRHRAINFHVRCNKNYAAKPARSEPAEVERYEIMDYIDPSMMWQEVRLHFRDGHVETHFWYSWYEDMLSYREGDYTLVTFT